jgi:hypothetical protein
MEVQGTPILPQPPKGQSEAVRQGFLGASLREWTLDVLSPSSMCRGTTAASAPGPRGVVHPTSGQLPAERANYVSCRILAPRNCFYKRICCHSCLQELLQGQMLFQIHFKSLF